jgi:hypothetical protein
MSTDLAVKAAIETMEKATTPALVAIEEHLQTLIREQQRTNQLLEWIGQRLGQPQT